MCIFRGIITIIALRLWITNILFMWIILELIFFLVMFLLISGGEGKINLNSVIYYLFVQALRGIFLLVSVLIEMFYFRNFYYLNNNLNICCWILGVLRLLLKARLFPFYIQVYQIIRFISFNQLISFLLFPKVLPILIIYELIRHFEGSSYFIFLPMLTLFVAGVQGVLSNDVREILAWSRLSQLSWFFVSILGSLFYFVVYFFLYSCLLFFFAKWASKRRKKIFFDFYYLRSQGETKRIMIFILFLQSRLAPFLLFLIKLLLLYRVSHESFIILFFILLGSLGVFFFYVRIFQMLASLGRHSGEMFSHIEFYVLKRNLNYFLFFSFLIFIFRGFFVLV